jgi:hypothetical protein
LNEAFKSRWTGGNNSLVLCDRLKAAAQKN